MTGTQRAVIVAAFLCIGKTTYKNSVSSRIRDRVIDLDADLFRLEKNRERKAAGLPHFSHDEFVEEYFGAIWAPREREVVALVCTVRDD